MTDPIDDTPTKGRMIVNIVLLVLNLIIAIYLFRHGNVLLSLLFFGLGARNAYIAFTSWQGRR